MAHAIARLESDAEAGQTFKFDEKKIDAVFTDLNQCQLPGAAVGIALGGRPVYRKGFGLASMELPVVLSPGTRMRIGSVSKQFTCLAYLLLCEDGRARLEDPVEKYLPKLHPVAHGVTVRQLMNHTSGLRDAMSVKLQLSGKAGKVVSTSDLLAYHQKNCDLNAPPGVTFIYNNGCYVILSAIVERIAQQPLENVLRYKIFEPIGMVNTMLRRWDTDFVPNCATTHALDQHGGYRKLYYGADFAGGGAIISTIDDMLRWMRHMESPVVGTAVTWDAMKTPHLLANGTSTEYGLGLFNGRYRGVETLYHAGGWTGGNALMLKVPAAHLDIMIMTNREDVSAFLLANKILDMCLSGLSAAVAAPDRPLPTGVFRSPATRRVVRLVSSSNVPWADKWCHIMSIDGLDMAIEAIDAKTFRPTGVFAGSRRSIQLLGDPQCPSAIRLSDYGNVDELLAVASAERRPAPIEGAYRSEATETEAVIFVEDGCLRLRTSSPFGFAVRILESFGAGVWNATSKDDSLSLVLSFDDDYKGFRMFTRSLQGLIFRRLS